MDTVTLRTHISAPRQEVYRLLADVALRPAWCDHFMKDFRLVTPRAAGVGAGARFRLDAPGGRRYVEFTIVDARAARRLREDGRTGRMGRTGYGAEYELTDSSRGVTRVEMSLWTEPENAIERLREAFRFKRWMRRRTGRALDRLRRIAEGEVREPLPRATIAGYEGRKYPRFGTRAGKSFLAEDGEGPSAQERPQPGRVAE